MTGHLNSDRILAVDIGTSSVRAAVFEPTGAFHAATQVKYDTIRPAPFREEQDPDLVRNRVLEAIRVCLANPEAKAAQVRGVAFSSQMYGIFPVDAAGRATGNSILWSDGRAEAEAEAIRAQGRHEALYRASGCPANSIYPLAKLIWMRAHLPDRFAAAARFVSIKEYVMAPMIGDWVVDQSMASATGLLDIRTQRWSEVALREAGVETGRLSTPVPGDEGRPFSNDILRAELGLPAGAVVYPGGGDGPLANLGSGAGAVGAVNIDLGTSGAARVVVDRVTLDPGGRLWCYCLAPGRWALGGILTNVGNAYQWLATNVAAPEAAPEATLDRLNALAAAIAPGADGLFFLPYLRKVRSPYWDNRLQGAMFGLTAGHDIGHMARALLEAIAYDLAALLEIAAAHAPVKTPLVLTGGLSRSPILPQLLADVLGVEIRVPSHAEGSLAGAAIVGLKGAGLIRELAFETASAIQAASFRPDAARHQQYRPLRAGYAQLVTMVQQAAPAAGMGVG